MSSEQLISEIQRATENIIDFSALRSNLGSQVEVPLGTHERGDAKLADLMRMRDGTVPSGPAARRAAYSSTVKRPSGGGGGSQVGGTSSRGTPSGSYAGTPNPGRTPGVSRRGSAATSREGDEGGGGWSSSRRESNPPTSRSSRGASGGGGVKGGGGGEGPRAGLWLGTRMEEGGEGGKPSPIWTQRN